MAENRDTTDRSVQSSKSLDSVRFLTSPISQSRKQIEVFAKEKLGTATFTLISLVVIDAIQILSLAVISEAGPTNGVIAVIPTPSLGTFFHVFLDNWFWGAQEIIPLYSVFALCRSLYSLAPSIALLSATWHVSNIGTIIRIFSFAYSWLEISMYSYALTSSFAILKRILEHSLTVRFVMRTIALVTVGFAIAAALEVMATMMLWT